MSIQLDTATFIIDVVGDQTGEHYSGVFRTKLRLSHRLFLKQDQVRKELLGPNPESSSPRAINLADCFSLASVYIVESPSWWRDSGGGIEMQDDNIIGAVVDGIISAKNKALEDRKKDTDVAKTVLKDPIK
jgi:hypothetical protein